MALARIDDYETQDSGSITLSCFWNLQVNAEHGSKKIKKELSNGKEAWGYIEDGWFLGRFKDVVVISAHERGDKDMYLCNKSFESEGQRLTCPMCDDYFTLKDKSQYGYRKQFAMIPFLVCRNQDDPYISTGKKPRKVLPIYWFRMNITAFREDYKANYLRLRDANESKPIHKYPYRIFAKKRGEKEIQEWHFSALKESDAHEITVEHPIIDDWLDPKTGKWLWNRDYQEMLSALCISRFKPYVDPSTREVFDYNGEYEAATAIFEEVLERYGSPTTDLEEGEYDDEYDDDEELN